MQVIALPDARFTAARTREKEKEGGKESRKGREGRTTGKIFHVMVTGNWKNLELTDSKYT